MLARLKSLFHRSGIPPCNDSLWMMLGRHSLDVLIMLALPLLLFLADHAPAC
jgi:hypothetical protein